MLIKRSFSVDATGTLVAMGFTTLLSLPTSVLLARYLGPEGKGVLTILRLVLGQASWVLTLGVEIALIHYAGRRQWSLSELASASMGLGLLLGVIGLPITVVVLVFGFRPVIPHALFPFLLLMASTIPLTLIMGFLRSLVRVLGRVVEEAVLSVLCALFNLATVTIALVLGFGLQGVIVGFWTSNIVLGLVTVLLGRRWGIVRTRPTFAPSIWKPLVTYGLKLHAGSVLQSLNYRLDLYFVAFLSGPASVGLYSISVAMAEWLWLLPDVLGRVLMQRVATRSDEDANVMMGSLNRLTSGILLIGIVVWAVVGGWVIRLLYGEAFASSYYPLLLLLPGIWALGLWKNFMNDLAVRGHPAYKSYTSGVAVVVTIILDIVLIPRWGVAGAALASTVAYIAAFATALRFYRRITSCSPSNLLIPNGRDIILVFGKLGLAPRYATVQGTSTRLRMGGEEVNPACSPH